MKTLAHQPSPLHSQVVAFSHELSPPKPSAWPTTITPFDYELCMEEFFQQKRQWASFPSAAHLMRGRPSTREVVLWLSLMGDERRYSYPPAEDDYFRQTYPASRFEDEPDDAAMLKAVVSALKTHLDDGRVISLVDLVLPYISLNTLLDALLEHVSLSLCGAALRHLQKTRPHEVAQAAERLGQQLDTLQTWERPSVELQLCVLREDLDGLVSWFEQDHHLAFSSRTLAMEALGLIKDWETFRRVAYELIENYSPLALRMHLENFGAHGLAEAFAKIKDTWSSTWGCVFQIHHTSITELALWAIQDRNEHDVLWLDALRWLHREGANAIVGALQLWEDEAVGHAAQDLLKTYIEQGHETLVLELAQTHAPQHIETLQTWAQAEPAPDAPLPAGCEALEYWFKRGMRHPIPDGISPHFPILTADGHPLSPAQIEGLLRLLQDHKKARAQEDSKLLGLALHSDSRSKLAAHMLTAWLRADMIPRLAWCLHSLAPLCTEGMEHLYIMLKAKLIEQWRPVPWAWRVKSYLSGVWRQFIDIVIQNKSPTREALLVNELSAPPFYQEHQGPWVAPTEALTSEGEHDARSRLDSFEDSLLACRLAQPELAALYFNGIDQLHAKWELPQWRRLAKEMARADVRTRTLWMLERGEGEDALIFRLDMDGSLLNAQDEEVTLAPSDATISRVMLEQLSPGERAAWEQTLATHEIVLYSPPNYDDDDDDDDEDEEE